MSLIQAPEIGPMLRKYVKAKRIYQSGWARKMGFNPKTIARYLKRKTMMIDTLFTISQTLNYNFLREIAELLPADMPPINEHPLQARVTELEQQNHDLQLQVKTLKEALSLMSGK